MRTLLATLGLTVLLAGCSIPGFSGSDEAAERNAKAVEGTAAEEAGESVKAEAGEAAAKAVAAPAVVTPAAVAAPATK